MAVKGFDVNSPVDDVKQEPLPDFLGQLKDQGLVPDKTGSASHPAARPS